MRLSQREILIIFLKAGFAYGAGLGMAGALENERAAKRRALTREEFLAAFGLGRIVPNGAVTALAVAFSSRLGGWLAP